MALHHLLPVLLLLPFWLGTISCFPVTSHLHLAFGRNLARRVTGGDQEDSSPVLEQLLARKIETREYINSKAFNSYLRQQRRHYKTHPADKQGILIVAGGRDMFANAAITIMTLRQHMQSQLPVEIVHFGQSELPPANLLSILQSLNKTSNNSTDWSGGRIYITDALHSSVQSRVGAHHKQYSDWKGFPAKPFALAYATRFQQVMLVDADSMPLVDPALLLEMPAFLKSGNLFWPDFWWNAWVNETIYPLVSDMDRAPWHGDKDFRLTESGQILFDRVKHAEVLEYLWLLNSHHEWVYKHMHGDKDTYLLAFAMAGKGKQYKQVQTYMRDGMTDQLGHKHRYHHLGGAQSIPYNFLRASVAKALRGGSTSKAAQFTVQRLLNMTRSTGSGSPTHLVGSSAAHRGPSGLPEDVRLSKDLQRHAGVPVVFHRTSFNSKFFPDCLDQNKIITKYCEIQYMSVPISPEQAGNSLKPNMFAFDEHQINTTFYEQHCKVSKQKTTPATQVPDTRHLLQRWQHEGLLQRGHRSLKADANQSAALSWRRAQQLMTSAIGLPPEWDCDTLTVGDSEMPMGVMPVQLFGHMFKVLQYSYKAFKEVRERLKV